MNSSNGELGVAVASANFFFFPLSGNKGWDLQHGKRNLEGENESVLNRILQCCPKGRYDLTHSHECPPQGTSMVTAQVAISLLITHCSRVHCLTDNLKYFLALC